MELLKSRAVKRDLLKSLLEAKGMKVKLAAANIKSHGYIRGFRIFYCVYYSVISY